MRNKWLFFLFLVFCWLLFGSGLNGAGHEKVTVNVISGPFGTGAYVVNSAIEDMLKRDHPWLRIDHSESPGYVYNLKKINNEPKMKKNTIIGSGLVLSWMAEKGMKPFDKKYEPAKLIGNYFYVSNWLATLDSNIKTGKDLVGKKIALGRTPQVNWTIEPEAIITHGWGIRDQVKIEYTGTKEAAKALLDGLVDAAIMGGYFNPVSMKFSLSPATLEFLASGRTIYFIPWGRNAVEKTKAALGMPLIYVELPPNIVKFQPKPLDIYTDTTSWYAAPEFPEELAYEFTKFVINNVSRFSEYCAVGKLMSRKALPFAGTPETIHPGALRAYRDAGILK